MADHTIYGTDILCHRGDGIWDLDPTFTVRGGDAVLLEHMARALQTAPGTMPDEPDRGYDVSELEAARSAAGAARTIQQRVEYEIRQDERIDALEVQVRIEGEDLMIDVRGQGETGPFEGVFALSEGTVSILTSPLEVEGA